MIWSCFDVEQTHIKLLWKNGLRMKWANYSSRKMPVWAHLLTQHFFSFFFLFYFVLEIFPNDIIKMSPKFSLDVINIFTNFLSIQHFSLNSMTSFQTRPHTPNDVIIKIYVRIFFVKWRHSWSFADLSFFIKTCPRTPNDVILFCFSADSFKIQFGIETILRIIYILINGIRQYENFRTSGSCEKPRTERLDGSQEEWPERILNY